MVKVYRHSLTAIVKSLSEVEDDYILSDNDVDSVGTHSHESCIAHEENYDTKEVANLIQQAEGGQSYHSESKWAHGV